jgi:hypothetical protein
MTIGLNNRSDVIGNCAAIASIDFSKALNMKRLASLYAILLLSFFFGAPVRAAEQPFVSAAVYGVKCDGTSDNLAPLLKAIAAQPETGGGRILLPPGICYFSDALNITKPIFLQGAIGSEFSTHGTVLKFAVDKSGIIVNRHNTLNSTTVANNTYPGAYETFISDLSIVSMGHTVAGSNGLWFRARASARNVLVQGFGSTGFKVVAELGGGVGREGNANSWFAENIRSYSNAGHGVEIEGCDSNAGTGINWDISGNGGYGILEHSCFGNTHIGHHLSGNTVGQIHTSGGSNKSIFLGIYTEGPGPLPSHIAAPAISIGGLHAAGFTATSNGLIIDGTTLPAGGMSWNSTNSGVLPVRYAQMGDPDTSLTTLFAFGSTADGPAGWRLRYDGSVYYYQHGLSGSRVALQFPGTGATMRAWAPGFPNGVVIGDVGSGARVTSGAGSPAGVVSGNPGDLYTNTSGGAGTTLYVKESGTGNTGWVAK